VQALSKFCCQNKKRPDYRKRNGNNLLVCGLYGKNNHKVALPCARHNALIEQDFGCLQVSVNFKRLFSSCYGNRFTS